MGADSRDASPVHEVSITRGFWLSRYETTVAQYVRYCQQSGAEVPAGTTGPEHPIGNLDWHKASAYCERYGMRLPTEAMWEYAARGPQNRVYPWGDDPNSADVGNFVRQYGVGLFELTSVGRYPKGASWCGVQDMIGNASEWCSDWFQPDYYRKSPREDPQGAPDGYRRCMRDAGYHSNAYPASMRNYAEPRMAIAGIRPAIVPQTQQLQAPPQD